jgi:hypothetical protein
MHPPFEQGGRKEDGREFGELGRLQRQARHRNPSPVERFFPAETYSLALRSLLTHYETGQVRPRRIRSTPGYFVHTDAPPPASTPKAFPSV